MYSNSFTSQFTYHIVAILKINTSSHLYTHMMRLFVRYLEFNTLCGYYRNCLNLHETYIIEVEIVGHAFDARQLFVGLI